MISYRLVVFVLNIAECSVHSLVYTITKPRPVTQEETLLFAEHTAPEFAEWSSPTFCAIFRFKALICQPDPWT